MGLAQYADHGVFAPRRIAEALQTTSEDIARTAGLGKDAIQRKDRGCVNWSRSSPRSSRGSARR
jgi:hypothetical protein